VIDCHFPPLALFLKSQQVELFLNQDWIQIIIKLVVCIEIVFHLYFFTMA